MEEQTKQEELAEDTQEEAVTEESVDETVESEETQTSESEEKPQEEEEDIDYYTPEAEEKPQRTEKDKAIFTLKSVAERLKEVGGDPAEVLGIKKPENTSDFITKRDFAEAEARKLARSDKEVSAIMAWVDKGLSVEDAHFIANKGKVKSVFSEQERANVRTQEATGAGQKKPVVTSPQPSTELLSMWSKAKMTWDPIKKIAVGKFTESYWDGNTWASRKRKSE